MERFDSGTYTTYYGRALAVVRAKEAGTMRVTVTGNGIGKKSVQVEVDE